MSIGECKCDEVIKYCVYDNEYYVGNNSTVSANAPILGQSFEGTLVIPDFFESKPVVALGRYAFTGCRKLTKAIIGNNVREIHCYALGDLPNLETIFIPSSTEFIAANGIVYYNYSGISMSKGIKQVFFGPNSRLKILKRIFRDSEHVQIFTPNIINAKCFDGTFGNTKRVSIISSYSFSFCGVKSRVLCTNKHRTNHLSLCALSCILSLLVL